MTVYMVEMNQGLQANLLLLVILSFVAIHYFNAPYYKRSLNTLNIIAMGSLALFSFSRVLIRSSMLESGDNNDDNESIVNLLGS